MKYLPKDKVERQVAAEGLIAGEKQADDEVLSRLEQISQIPEINLKYAQLFNKETYFLLELIRDFYHMLEPEAEALENFYDGLTEACNETLFPPDIAKISEITESLRQYRVKVHSMKSSAAMVGAVGLSGMAFCLEKAAREGKLDVIWYVTPSFLEEWRSYEDKLAVLDEDSAGEDDLIAEEDF
jgi:HPt (histidine-containing phosphotransfer) domain-containing protein